jgi:(p)ppGpp synthase/HD superfamily hydrolase
LVATWLHDTLEDTNATYEELEVHFGREVADLVQAVTDAPGKNRKERKAKTYPMIRKAGKYAVAIKLADRLANMKAAVDEGKTDLQRMYTNEYWDMYEALYDENDGLDTTWNFVWAFTL